ncbi:MAG: hypothetical protein VZR00_08910, partial [Lachnospiraceae bacterium]|nr:hypothetical protein [Lachnospiraceae bacterium]MEE3461988.1 hypothetical protein [Lachnospiraceae bacterium]
MLNFEISVRGLVGFICRSGSIDRGEGSALDPNAMQEGIKAHKSFQASQGPDYDPEVSLSGTFFINKGKDCMDLKVSGRADGIFEGKKYIHENVTINGITSVKTTHKNIYTVDEIKSTYRNTRKMKEPYPVHLAQAKCYAYLYSRENHLTDISVRMVYIGINNKKTTYFNYDYTFGELAQWFRNVINNFAIFALWQYRHILDRNSILKDAPFPFEYRPGQDSLTKDVYRSILREKRLFIEAPTGAGKTVSTLYPAVIGLCYGLENRIFYLTAKTITRTVACKTLEDIESALPSGVQPLPHDEMRDGANIRSEAAAGHKKNDNGLLRSVVITAREKICPLENGKCSPRDCPYARGHFDRINAALLYLLKNETLMDQNVFERYGEERKVCPYYLAIDAAMFSDVVICDYNYAFDPEVSFKDLFTPGSTPDISGKFAKKPVFLIDEAHNLVRRAREMYSARISTEDIRRFKAVINKLKKENAKYKEKNEGKAEEDAEPSHKQLSIFDSSDTKYITDKVPGISNDRDEDQGTREDDDGDGPESGAYALRNILMRVTRSVNVLDKRLKEADEKASYGYYNTEKLDPEQTDTIVKTLEPLIKSISRLLGNSGFQKILHASKASDEFLDFYFNVLKVNNTFAECDDSYLFYLTDENINGSNPSDSGGFLSFRKNGTQKKNICLHLKNMSPRTMLSPYLDRARASILFSATLLPVNYFFNELGGREDDYKIYA